MDSHCHTLCLFSNLQWPQVACKLETKVTAKFEAKPQESSAKAALPLKLESTSASCLLWAKPPTHAQLPAGAMCNGNSAPIPLPNWDHPLSQCGSSLMSQSATITGGTWTESSNLPLVWTLHRFQITKVQTLWLPVLLQTQDPHQVWVSCLYWHLN